MTNNGRSQDIIHTLLKRLVCVFDYYMYNGVINNASAITYTRTATRFLAFNHTC